MRIRPTCVVATTIVLFLTAALSGRVAFAEDGETASVVSPEAKLAAKAIQVPAGFTLETVASEPNFSNPVAFCFDPNGRIFIAETYRVGKGIEDNRRHMDWLNEDLAARTVADRIAYYKKHLGAGIDKYTSASELVRLLEDRDRDGMYEVSSIFSTDYKNIEDGTAAGVMWSNGRLLFTCIPSLVELRDTDGDGKADERKALVTGFGVHTAFYGHDLHGLCEGPDGKIYFSIGDRGLNVATPNGPVVNTGSGSVLRCNRDGSQLEIFATGLRNPQELAFNELGDLFTVDNNSDSGDKPRLVHIVEGMDAGWRMWFQYLADRGPFNREKIWYTQNGEQPASIIPPLGHITDGPSGLVYYPGTGLTKDFDRAFFVVDFRGAAATSGIREFRVTRQGATYRLSDYKTFVSGVLATDCDFGPDGDFYVLDWVEGWSDPGRGRIHRVRCDNVDATKHRAATQETLSQIATSSASELVSLLGHADMRVRMGAQQKLVQLGPESAARFTELASKQNAPLLSRIHAIWGLGQLAEVDDKRFASIAQLLGEKDPEVRAQAVRTLALAAHGSEERRATLGAAIISLLADDSARVRGLAAITLGKLRQPALPQLMQLAEKDGNDPTMRHAIAFALAGGSSPEELAEASKGASGTLRLVLVVALGKQKSPLVAQLLNGGDERVSLEAARLIWDTPLPAVGGELAKMIETTKSTSEPLLRRVLAANVAQRSPENLQAVVNFACREDVDSTLRDLAWDLVRTWAEPPPLNSVSGDWRPLEARPVEDGVAVLRSSIPKLIAVGKANPGGLIIAAELGIEDAFDPLIAVVNDEGQPEDVRVRAVGAFGKSNDTDAHRLIDAARKSRAAGVRSAGRKLASSRFPEQVVEHLGETLTKGTMPERQSAMDMLSGLSGATADALVHEWMGRLESGECPPELQIEVLEAAGQSKDAALVERQKRFQQIAASGDRVSQFANCVSGGNVERGQKIFETNETLACRRCHSMRPGEVLVGPSLASVGIQRKPVEILESIVTPNSKITEGFETAVLELDSGKVVTGIVRREDASRIELVDAEAKTIAIDVATVENRIKGKSAMPDNVIDNLSPRALRDLVAFLVQQRAAVTGEAADAASGRHE